MRYADRRELSLLDPHPDSGSSEDPDPYSDADTEPYDHANADPFLWVSACGYRLSYIRRYG